MMELGRVLNAPFRPRGRGNRDSQRGKVYAAERAIPELRVIQFVDLDAVAKYARSVVASKWWARQMGYKPELRVVSKRARSGAHCSVIARLGTKYVKAELAFSVGSFSKMIVLHELAHIPKTPTGEGAHGRSFCRLYLALVRRFLGCEIEACLRREMKEHGVKWIRTGARKGNPAALLKWIERRAAEREERQGMTLAQRRAEDGGEYGGDGPDD